MCGQGARSQMFGQSAHLKCVVRVHSPIVCGQGALRQCVVRLFSPNVWSGCSPTMCGQSALSQMCGQGALTQCVVRVHYLKCVVRVHFLKFVVRVHKPNVCGPLNAPPNSKGTFCCVSKSSALTPLLGSTSSGLVLCWYQVEFTLMKTISYGLMFHQDRSSDPPNRGEETLSVRRQRNENFHVRFQLHNCSKLRSPRSRQKRQMIGCKQMGFEEAEFELCGNEC